MDLMKEIEIAKSFLENTNTSLEDISVGTVLSLKEVQKLKIEINSK